MVKQGYKETEIGVIPDDWRVEAFANVGDFYKGSGISMKDVKPSGFPCIMYGDIYVKFDTHFNKCDYHIDFDIAQKSARAQNGDVFFTASGETAEDIGKCVTYQGSEDIYIGGDIIAVHPFPDYNGLYLSYVQNSDSLKKQKASYAQGHSVVHINSQNIKKLLFACPPLSEQIRISDALLDVDSMIFSLEKLIAKKKAIKQGTMHELLSGKKRLPGFTEEWKEIRIADCANIFDNLRIPVAEFLRESGQTPYYGANGIQDYVKGYTHNGEFVLIAEDGANDLANYPVQYVNGKIWANNHVHVLQGKINVCNTLFLTYALKIHDYKKILVGGTRAKLNGSALCEMVLLIPTIVEQVAIASILSDMDNEIESLEQKLAKARQLKQGMMQQLLTGKIRLLTEEKSTVAIPASEPTDLPHSKSGHNQQFDDAVMIAAIVNAFYSDKYPLGRKKVQKLLYLLRRKQDEDVSAFKKKAAGPYADEVRYKGGEPIAKKQGYIVTSSTQKGTVFSKGKKIDTALSYVDKWQMQSYIDWLTSTFKYIKTNDLELYATIDMAICDLQHEGITVSVDSVKDLIRSNKEWKDKLTKTYFSDADIARAIAMCKSLYS